MQKSNNTKKATTARRKVMSSTTLNRKYVSKPVARKGVDMENVKTKMRMKKQAKEEPATKTVTAKELKDQAIRKALANASKEDRKEKTRHTNKLHFGIGRILLALGCATAAVFAIVYFVNLNMPDISLKVAAMQTGIEASYPSYVPRDFKLSDITSEDGKVTLNFNNPNNGDSFLLVEERSTWDSNALLSNYVREEYGENYTIVRDQGLTIYISGGDASWVNGGIVFKLKSVEGNLTKKQICSIVVSL